MIIGLTGKMGSGKGEVASYLEKKGFRSYRFSDIIRDECKKRRIEPSRENLQMVGNKLREESGNPGILAKILREKASGNTVVDGIRNREEINELRKAKDFALISVDVDPKLRFDRMRTRARAGDPIKFDEFQKLEENENNDNPKGQELNYCMKQADCSIDNNLTMEDLYKKVDNILSNLKLLG